jgi:hypothetical protein
MGNIMSNKKELVKENLKELSMRIGLLITQYNALAKSEDLYERLIFAICSDEEAGAIGTQHIPLDIYDLVRDYNDEQGWSSSSENC